MKMKKSLLIVPAMATLLLAAAGSVGGTVAWFSANTTYDASAGNFSVAALDGNLSCELGDGIGTSTSTPSRTISVASGNFLADASYDHVNRTVWTDTNAGTNGVATQFERKATLDGTGAPASADDMVAANLTAPNKLYWAVTWKMTFKFVMSAAATTTNLYFNAAGSSATGAPQTGSTGTTHTYEGFRIAWSGLSATSGTCTANNRAWAPLHTSETDPAAFKYVQGTTTGSKESYATDGLMLKSDTHQIGTEATSGASNAVNCLGQFAGAANAELHLDFICVAWYEGNDDAVINASTKDIVSEVQMKFFVKPNA